MIDVMSSTLSLVAAMQPEMIESTVITNARDLTAIRDRWLQVQKRCGVSASREMYDLFVGTIDVIGGRATPYVVIFSDDRGGRAMIVARLTQRAMPCKFGYLRLKTPNLLCLEIMDGGLITDGTAAARVAILSHLRERLASREVELIVVEHLPIEHDLFPSLWPKSLYADREVHWKLSLAGGYEAVLKKFSGKHRLTLRKKDRVLVEHFSGNVEVKQFTQPDQLETFLQQVSALVAKTYQGALGVGVQDNPRWRAILNLEAQAGRFRGYWLECDGSPIAFHLGAIWDGTYKLLAMSFLPEFAKISPGIVLHMRVLQLLCAEGATAVDYGFGDADYKRTYGSQSWEEATLYLYGTTPRAMLAWMLTSTCGIASRNAKKIIAATGA